MSGKIQGNLKIMSLPDVLQWISLAQKSGSLIFQRGEEKKVVFFRDGVIMGANSNNPKDKIGEILIRMEVLSPEAVEEGLRLQKVSGELIGDILLAQGHLSTKEFVAALERQATQILFDLFAWQEGGFIFQERLPKARTIPIAITVDFILMEGLRRVDEWQVIREAFPTLDIILDWSEKKAASAGGAGEESLLELINGRNTIQDICDQSPINDFETCNLLYHLYRDRKLRKIGTRSSHEILEGDDPKRLIGRGKAFYQKGKFEDAIPFFEGVIKVQPHHQEAKRFLARSISAVQDELLKALGSPNAVLEIDKGFRLEEAQDLTASEGFVLSRIDGRSTAKEITFVSGLSQVECCLTLNRLFTKGIIRAGKDKERRRGGEGDLYRCRVLPEENRRMDLPVSDTFLPEVFLDLIKQRQTGVLQLVSPPMDSRVYIREGAIVYADSNMESDRCGSILLRKGKISEKQYRKVKDLSERERILQGNALVKLGILSPNDLIWLTKTQVEEILVSLFGWRKGRIRFFEIDPDGFDIIRLKLSPGRMILDGTWRYYEEEEILKIFGSRDVLLDLVESPPLSRRELELTGIEMEIIGEVNGKHSIREIASRCGLQELEVFKVLFGFYSLGLVQICGIAGGDKKTEMARVLREMQEKWGEVQRENLYRILGLEPDADDREIKKRFFLFSRKYHPDRCFRYPDRKILDLMLNIFLAGKEAYDILSDPGRRKEYDNFLRYSGESSTRSDYQQHIKPHIEVGPILKAEDHFNKARALLFSGRTGEALNLLEKVLELVPDDPDYNAYTGLAVARLKKDYRRAVGLLEKALESNPGNADYHAFLGEVHQRYGKKQRALQSFQEALAINPRHIQAKRACKRLMTS